MSLRHGLALTLLVLLGCRPAAPLATSLAPVASPHAGTASLPAPAAAPAPTVTPRHVAAPELSDIGWDDLSVFRDGLAATQQAVLQSHQGMSVYHLDLTVSEDLAHVDGLEEVRYTNTESVPLDQLEFRLFPNLLGGRLSVSHAAVNGSAVQPQYGLESSLMTLPLPKPLEVGEQAVVSLDFSVELPADLDQNLGLLSAAQGILAYDHGYPVLAVYNSEGWNAEIPAPWGDLSFTDASYYLVRLSSPAALKIAASGSRISHDVENGRQVDVFAAGPARDFYFVASADFQVMELKAKGVTLRGFVPAADSERASFALDTAEKALQVYSSHYGDYPYTEFEFAATPVSFLGVEYPGVVVLNQALLSSESDLKVAPELAWLESTMAHEVAHQWFYNLVGNDQLDEPWLDESLAQFATLQYFQDADGTTAARQFEETLDARWSRVEEKAIPIGQPVSSYDPASYSAIVYGRGALFMEALAREMGQQAFYGFMKDYAESESWQIATTGIFRSLAEQHCSCDLSKLFQQWIYP